jgi:hypothetical protein
MSASNWFKLPDGNEAGACADLLGHSWDVVDESGDGWKHVIAICRKCQHHIDFWQRERPTNMDKAARARKALEAGSDGEA